MAKIGMAEALRLAELGCYSAHPNPMVGCVIVKNGKIIGQGYHQKAGTPHAEVHALAEAGEQAKGATVYVTLEPCSHFGRTPPCVDALIAAGVHKVVIACVDPNPLVAGKGIQKLRAHQIEVEVGMMAEEARNLNRVFFHYITTKTPYVVAKWAMSLDGKMVVNPNDDRQLSNNESTKDLHELRHRLPGILIGAGTALADDPSLTVRFTDMAKPRQPQRIVLNTQGDLPKHLKLFNGSLPGKTWVVCSDEAKPTFSAETTEIIHCPMLAGQLNLEALVKTLGARELSGILVEGGPRVLESFFAANLVNEVVAYLTPWIIGSSPHKTKVQQVSFQNLAGDCKTSGILK